MILLKIHFVYIFVYNCNKCQLLLCVCVCFFTNPVTALSGTYLVRYSFSTINYIIAPILYAY